jgi:gamma-glutamylcyclotransferase (GGCT)/AIG2-like uncharacterized protein YtfP
MPDLPYLFVYGSLRRAACTQWSKFLADDSRFVGSGHTHGALFQLDGYPGMTVSPSEEAWVTGEVYLLHEPSSLLRSLDAYEGCGPDDALPHAFERQVVTVVLDSGQSVEAWAYIYKLATDGKSRLTSGDYLRRTTR